ncbi:hypothetical protein ELH49_09235 [Rhizobium ruizarguesonis]|jgi:hypothetical protein|uniref:hypothetical protein n=1 Tax=Rhizobium ruizarguesonis TaxID=2081791 RepID=UPI001030CDB9|nr:hypothetical protein [Rhizobium ruizarguesonis]TBB44203.1 hypothetical protein ELH49_09235 [Rhizobium ruizarguesonis]
MLIDESEIEALNDAALRRSGLAQRNLALASKAIDLLHAFASEQAFNKDDDVTVIRLAIRVLNDAGASGKCALAGYYQQALAHIRDIIEVAFLLDLFRRKPDQIRVWREASEKDRKRFFKPVILRETLDKLDGREDKARQEAYSFYSGFGTHVTPHLELISPNSLTQIGPFPSEQIIVLLTYDLTKWLCAATGYAMKSLDPRRISDSGRSMALTKQKLDFALGMTNWLATPQVENSPSE